MKKKVSLFRRSISISVAIVVLSILFSACKKDLTSQPNTPAAGLMAFNLVPDNGPISITLSNNNFTTNPLAYTNYTGAYRGVYVGNRDVISYDYNSNTQLAMSNQLFEDSAYYSLFVVGANGNISNVIVKDNFDSLSSTSNQAFVRYINAIPDSTKPMVNVSSDDAQVFNESTPFAMVTNFKPVTPGDINIAVSNGSDINATRTITVESGKIYTILLSGLPNATDSSKTVQIKFIQNGSITP
jgi:hypothetical protein